MKHRKMIACCLNTPRNIRKKYLDKRKNTRFVFIEIYPDRKYGAVAKLFHRNDLFTRARERIGTKEMEKLGRSLSRRLRSRKKVDTSKWVKPDEESLRNEMTKNLFLCEILKEDYFGFKEARTKAATLYSILHSTSPSNPQTLTNYCIGTPHYFETIISELGGIAKNEKMKIEYPNWRQGLDYKKWKHRPINVARRMYKRFVRKSLRNMILKEGEIKWEQALT